MTTTVPDSYAGAVNAMLSSLAEIEDLLEPLFTTSTSLNETLAKLDTEKRCQLELMVAYAINTLAFVNLKTNGTAPNTHPVMKELARIKNYTEKLKNATTVSKPSMNIDKDAADRFIRGALASNNIADKKEESDAAAQKAKEADSTESVSSTPSSSSTKKHKRFDPFQGYENQQQTTSSSRPSASSSTDGPSRKKAKSKQ
ncbi:DNA-binding protein c1d [Actinomortierella wolfii]|nr:DNA-binding protein c1d [Actinomortierella wolfii]